jgi:hypothetical protein
MGVPYTFSTASQTIPLAQLDANFATPVTIGSTTVALGQTVTTLANVTLSNVTILSGSATFNNLTGNVTFGNTTVNLGNSSSSIGNLTLNNVQINSGNLSSAVIPTANGTVMLSGNMPAFSVYCSTAQAIPTFTYTKVALNTKNFDTNTNFDVTTNYRFTPTVAGYYAVFGTCYYTVTGPVINAIYKNGSSVFTSASTSTSGGASTSVSGVVFMNGTTDYLELYTYQGSGGSANLVAGAPQLNNFFGSMVRGA